MTIPLFSIGLFVSGQPQGYTLVLTPTQYFNAAPWMNVKAIYMKADTDNLYCYMEYAGAIPNSKGSYRQVYLYMDTDNSTATGYQSHGLGADYEVYFYLYGDNSSSYVKLYSWNATAGWWQSTSANVGLTRAPGLNYLEAWVPRQAVGYSASGVYFYINAYVYTGGVLKTGDNDIIGSYTLGSHQRTIDADGNAGDWGDTPATVTFPADSNAPAELVCSASYMANDLDNLYLRFDMRGTPTQRLGAGTLYRYFYLYVNTDDDNTTGYLYYGGADYEVDLSFSTGNSRSSYANFYRYTGTGDNWSWDWFDSEGTTTANGNILEASIPLAKLGLGTSGRISFLIDDLKWYLSDSFPRPSQFIQFPATVAGPATSDLGIVKLFGSETVFLAVVVGLMLVEGVLVYIIARRGGGRVSPPPPP
jgi:hypothetical protein